MPRTNWGRQPRVISALYSLAAAATLLASPVSAACSRDPLFSATELSSLASQSTSAGLHAAATVLAAKKAKTPVTSTCLASTVLHWIAPSHLAALPQSPLGISSFAEWFASLRAPSPPAPRSVFWQAVSDFRNVVRGDIIALDAPSSNGFDDEEAPESVLIAAGTPVVVTQPSGACSGVSSIAADGSTTLVPGGTSLASYTKLSVEVWAANDTRTMSSSPMASMGMMVVKSTAFVYVDPSNGLPFGIQLKANGRVYSSPQFTIAAGRALQPSPSSVPIQSAALCDALGSGHPMLVATKHLPASSLGSMTPVLPSLMVFRGDVGIPAREISLPSYADMNVNVACGDIFPGGAAEAVLVPGDGPWGPAASMSSPSKLKIVNVFSGAVLFEETLPFSGPASVAVGDFDHDGYQDVAFAAASNISATPYNSSADVVFVAFSTGASRPAAMTDFFTVEAFATSVGASSGLSLSASTLFGGNNATSTKSILAVVAAGNHTAMPVVELWERAAASVTPPSPSATAWSLAKSISLPAAFNEGGRVLAISSSFVQGYLLAVSTPTLNANSSAQLIDLNTATPSAASLAGGLPAGLDGGRIWSGSSIQPETPPVLVSGGALFPPPSSGSFSAAGSLAPAFFVTYRGMTSLFFRGVTNGAQAPNFKQMMPILSPSAGHITNGLQPPNPSAHPWHNIASNAPGALHASATAGAGSVYLSKAGVWKSYSSDAVVDPPSSSLLATAVVVPRNVYQRPYSGSFTFSEAQRSAYGWGFDALQASTSPLSRWYTSTWTSAPHVGPPLRTIYTRPGFNGSTSGAAYVRERLVTVALNFTVAPSIASSFARDCAAGTAVGLKPTQAISYQNHRIPLWSPDNRQVGYSYQSDARHTSGIDSANFVALVYSLALGLNMSTTVAGLAAASEAASVGASTTTTAYSTNVARKPVSYDRLVSMLKPGDIIFVDSGAAGGLAFAKQKKAGLSAHHHVAIWLGYTMSGGKHPLVIDSLGSMPPQIDANGFAIPPGPNVRPFSPESWYYKSFSHATRWIHDQEDAKKHFGAVGGTFSETSTGLNTAASLTEPANKWRGFGSVATAAADGVLAGSQLAIPVEFDPRASFCFQGPILNQGMCGSCWANSAAEIMSITLCLAVQSTFGIEQFSQISSQYAMAIGKNVAPASSGYQETQPCLGGITVESVFVPFVNWLTNNGQMKNTTIPVLTMDVTETILSGSSATAIGGNLGSSIPVPGLTGCLPYQEINCGSDTANVNANWIAANPGLCPNNYPTTECQNPPNGYTPDAVTASNSLAYFNAQANFIPNLSAGVDGFFDPPGYFTSSDIATIKSYLVNNGPISVAMSACQSFQAWFSGCVGNVGINTANQCVSSTAMPGYTWNARQGAYTAPVNASLITQPFNGPSCQPDQSGHAVTLVGFTTINGVDSWIIRNSWGINWGDGGHFYIPTATGACTTCSTGSVALSIPGFISFTPRTGYPLGPLPSTSLSSAFVAIPGSNGTAPNQYLGNGTLTGGSFPVTNPQQLTAIGNELVQAISNARGLGSGVALASMPTCANCVMEQVVQSGYIYSIYNASIYNMQSGYIETHSSTLFVPYGNAPIPVLASDSYILSGSYVQNGTVLNALGGGPGTSIFDSPAAKGAAIGVGVLLIILVLCCISFCVYRKRHADSLLMSEKDRLGMGGVVKAGGATGGAFVQSVARFSPSSNSDRLQYAASPISGYSNGSRLYALGSDVSISNNALRAAASFKPSGFVAAHADDHKAMPPQPSPMVYKANPMPHPPPADRLRQESRKRAAQGSGGVANEGTGASTPISASESVFAREQRARMNQATGAGAAGGV